MPEALTIRAFRNLDELRELAKAWEELLLEYPLATTFSSMEWLAPWWQSFGSGRQMLVLALFGSDSRLIGVAPLSIFRERFGQSRLSRAARLREESCGSGSPVSRAAKA